jgi:hypothetical protein
MSVVLFVKIVRHGMALEKTVTLELKGSDTSLEMMREIEIREGIPMNRQRLVFGGKLLDPNVTISEYGLERENFLHLIIGPEVVSAPAPTAPDPAPTAQESAPTALRPATIALQPAAIALHPVANET